MTSTREIQKYIELRRRFHQVVTRLTELGKIEEADYHMIYFFLFFEDFDRLKEFIIDSELMLNNNEW